MDIKSFDDFEGMLDYLREQNQAASEAAKDHPVKVTDLRHGDFFLSPKPEVGVLVFGEVLEHTDYPEETDVIARGRLNGYVYGRCYSEMCPEGEFGNTHIITIAAKIPRELFERAKANGFRHIESMD